MSNPKTAQTLPLSAVGQLPLKEVLLLFLGSRLLLIGCGYFAAIFPAYFNYPAQTAIGRGWEYTSWRWIDFWGRWDTEWYFSIMEQGYQLMGDPMTVKSNIAFYPLLPYLVKAVAALIPGSESQASLLLIGLVISNIAALLALILLSRLICFYLDDLQVARRTLWLILAFPSGFILSCFYTEAIFLLLAIGAFWYGSQKRWGIACSFVALAALCRPVGIGLAGPLLFLYLEQIQWRLNRIRPNVLWFLITPVGYFLFLYHIEQTTGNFLNTFLVQQAWDRHFSWPWKTLFAPYGWNIYHTPIQQLLTLVFFYGVYLAFRYLPTKSLPLVAVLILLPIFFTGRLSSTPRFYLVVFPVFIAYAYWIRKSWIFNSLLIAALLLQLVYFMGWVRFYWIF